MSAKHTLDLVPISYKQIKSRNFKLNLINFKQEAFNREYTNEMKL